MTCSLASDMAYLVRRYVVFALGLFCISLGIGIVTKASLGTSPITSIPYTLSMVFPSVTVGTFTILFSFLLVFLQWVLTGIHSFDRVGKVNLVMELFISVPFGYMVDLALWMLSGLNPDMLWAQILCVLVGIPILAIGVYMQVVAEVVMIPGDGFVYALTKRLGIGYGKVRLTSDTSMVLIAAAIGFACLGGLGGVGLGTVMSCLMTGVVARFYMARFTRLTAILVPGKHIERIANGRQCEER